MSFELDGGAIVDKRFKIKSTIRDTRCAYKLTQSEGGAYKPRTVNAAHTNCAMINHLTQTITDS